MNAGLRRDVDEGRQRLSFGRLRQPAGRSARDEAQDKRWAIHHQWQSPYSFRGGTGVRWLSFAYLSANSESPSRV
jgi:hypothetical protein